ncbi:hypothetical protein KAR91_39675 [Candidatus Pacearchaeota archaeon]|nr:hypothetical protein [Candidatus Pacearchaeota archaeon]
MTTKTKGQIVNKAFEFIRINGLTRGPSASEIVDGLNELESLMYELESRNVCSSYVYEDEPDPNTESGIENAFSTAASYQVASRLAPTFGKPLSVDQMKLARSTMSNWSASVSSTTQIIHPNRQPRGTGNNFRFPRWNRFYRDVPAAPNNCQTEETSTNQTEFYNFSIVDYLGSDTVSSYSHESTNGLRVLDGDSLVDGIWSYEVECSQNAQRTEQVQLMVNTSSGRSRTFVIYFNVRIIPDIGD